MPAEGVNACRGDASPTHALRPPVGARTLAQTSRRTQSRNSAAGRAGPGETTSIVRTTGPTADPLSEPYGSPARAAARARAGDSLRRVC